MSADPAELSRNGPKTTGGKTGAALFGRYLAHTGPPYMSWVCVSENVSEKSPLKIFLDFGERCADGEIPMTVERTLLAVILVCVVAGFSAVLSQLGSLAEVIDGLPQTMH